MTLFVGGVHAVGKTFILSSVCNELGLRHATASQLIREQRGSANWTASRQIEDIDENQRTLVAATRRLEKNGETIVLDGHLVLRRAENFHEKIKIETFTQLMIQGIILIEAPAEVITDRLRKRGDQTWQHSEIEVFAQKEVEHAEDVCAQLGISLVRLRSPTSLEMKIALAALMAKTQVKQEHQTTSPPESGYA